MKKILKIISTIICWIIAIYLLLEVINSFKDSDPWGLVFAFVTLPMAIIDGLFLYLAITITKELTIKNKRS